MDLKNNIAAARKKLGFTQEQLAEKCEVSRQAVTKWESGESEPAIAKLMMLAEIFDISIDELVNGKKNNCIYEQSKDSLLNYRDLSMMAFNLNRPLFQTKSLLLIYLEIIYDTVKTKYMDSDNRIYSKYLVEKTTPEERLEYVKFLIVGSVYSDDPFQNYVDGKYEIDVAFENLYRKIEDERLKVDRIEGKKNETQSAALYYKVRQLLNTMNTFKDLNEIKLKAVDNELSKMINEQDSQTQFGRIMLFYLKEIEYAWNCKDMQRLIELKTDGDELQSYIWNKIEI